MARKEAVFNVLNEWLDLPWETFERVWPELEEAVNVSE